tara:strand:+ start:1030 stop:1173 length:144 start_codon:yes stop_codon:yes gene_type:complete
MPKKSKTKILPDLIEEEILKIKEVKKNIKEQIFVGAPTQAPKKKKKK